MTKTLEISPADCILFDFADSFTYNIAAILHRLGLSCQVIPLKRASWVLKQLALNQKRKVLIFGPGPGSPFDYAFLFPLIKPLLSMPCYFHLGICLGHQLLAVLRGYRVVRCPYPRHGQREEFIIPPWSDIFPQRYINKKTLVQRYNSLMVEQGPLQERRWPLTGEILSCRFRGGVSFQFHPESVGTSFPALFFNVVTKFLYNKEDGQGNSDRRDLRSRNLHGAQRYPYIEHRF